MRGESTLPHNGPHSGLSIELLLAMDCGDQAFWMPWRNHHERTSSIIRKDRYKTDSNGAYGSVAPDQGSASRTTDARWNKSFCAGPSRDQDLQMIQAQPLRRIDDLAREFNLSHSHLEHLFKQQTGVSLGQLLTENKLHRAAHLLAHTNMRIKEIAHNVGYEHTSSFIRAFERHFFQAPRLYRKAPTDLRTKG